MKQYKNYKGEDVTKFMELVNEAYVLKEKYNDELHNRRYSGLYNCLNIAMYQSVESAWKYYNYIPSLI